MDLSADVARRLRLRSLLLDPAVPADRPTTVASVVEWFGAMQAQDANSAVWSLGCRLPGSTAGDVWAALERVEAVRTWPMRGTVHLVPPRDAKWMLEMMGARPLAGAAKRRQIIGLADETASRVVDVLGSTLAGGGRLTRSACLDAIRAAGIPLAAQQQYHVLWYASQLGVTVMHANVGAEATFALLDELVPDPHRPDRDEALSTMALRYVRSHGPTTRQDFTGWTGLSAGDAKRAIAAAGDAMVDVTVEGRDMLVDRDVLAAGPLPAPPTRRTKAAAAAEHLALAGFDEYMLGFKDRCSSGRVISSGSCPAATACSGPPSCAPGTSSARGSGGRRRRSSRCTPWWTSPRRRAPLPRRRSNPTDRSSVGPSRSAGSSVPDRMTHSSNVTSDSPIVATGLVRHFGDVRAVDGVDLEVHRGEIFGFLGPNGAGKSTTVRMLTTLLTPTAGTARVAGFDVVREADAVRRSIGVALQDAAIDPLMTGNELLELQAVLYGIPARVVRQRADELLERVGLTGAADRRVGTYSGGMRRRLDLALSLIHQPTVLFLDEPTTGLDPMSRLTLWEEVRRLNAEGTTVLLTTQYLEEADQLADRIAIIDHGHIVQQGTPSELKAAVGMPTLLVTVAGHEAEIASEVLRRFGDLRPTAEGTLGVGLSGGARQIADVVRALDEGGVGLHHLELNEPSLDDVFAAATGHRLEGAGGGTDAAPSSGDDAAIDAPAGRGRRGRRRR